RLQGDWSSDVCSSDLPLVQTGFSRNSAMRTVDARQTDSGCITGDSDLIVAALLRSLIGGTEATGHEAEAKFQKKTQQCQVHPALARPGTRQGRGVEQPELSRRKEGLSSRHR